MWELSKSQKARLAIRIFKTLADAVTLQGSYTPSGPAGEKLSEALLQLSPEIYGSMADPRVLELKGLEYVIDRMPRGIEQCSRIILTAQEQFQHTSFEKIVPLKRRRISYVVSPAEMCFIITHGLSEIYDVLTHITFLHIEAEKLYHQITSQGDGYSAEWRELERSVAMEEELRNGKLDRAIWNLSVLLGRTYGETRETYQYLEENRRQFAANNGLFRIIHGIGQRVIAEREKRQDCLILSFTPSLHEVIGHHKYGTVWARQLKEKLYQLGLHRRPLHIISANMHSVKNILFAAGLLRQEGQEVPDDLFTMVRGLRGRSLDCREFAASHGLHFLKDGSGANIDVQIIDTVLLSSELVHPALGIASAYLQREQPVLVVMDYAFGVQAFEILDELLCPCESGELNIDFNFVSISVMGKAGILTGKKGDVMLPTAHVMEGTPHNYLVENDLRPADFPAGVDVYQGPVVTVLGTSLQNRDMLERFANSSWRAVGLEMEGGHYQRAINAAIIRGHIPRHVQTRYAYYASDNPLQSGQTLASGPMGEEGIAPTYLITRIILEKILNPPEVAS